MAAPAVQIAPPTYRDATDAIVDMARQDAERIAAVHGWDVCYACRHGALRGLIQEMEHNNETPSEFVARVNGGQ